MSQIESWLATTFSISPHSTAITKTGESQITARFVDVRSHDSLVISIQKQSDFTTLAVTVMTEDIVAAALVVKSLASTLGLDNLTSTASFSRIRSQITDIADTVEQSNTLKTHFVANISENIQNIKVFTVRAEASLMIDDMDGMKKNYAQVQQENTALVNEHTKRQLNHKELLSALKALSAIIKDASDLRVG